VQKRFLQLSLNKIAILPLEIMQIIGAFLGLLAYVGSKQYRTLFRTQYEAVVQSHHLPFVLWTAVAESGKLFSDSLWIWQNPEKALKLVEVQNWDVVESA
jgi:KDO2-lipid IV(A) lauroyltransferase